MAGTLNDEIQRVTGGPTISDGLRAYYLAHGGTGTTLNDLERSWLIALTGVVSPQNYTTADLWRLVPPLGADVGTVGDRQLAYWASQ